MDRETLIIVIVGCSVGLIVLAFTAGVEARRRQSAMQKLGAWQHAAMFQAMWSVYNLQGRVMDTPAVDHILESAANIRQGVARMSDAYPSMSEDWAQSLIIQRTIKLCHAWMENAPCDPSPP